MDPLTYVVTVVPDFTGLFHFDYRPGHRDTGFNHALFSAGRISSQVKKNRHSGAGFVFKMVEDLPDKGTNSWEVQPYLLRVLHHCFDIHP